MNNEFDCARLLLCQTRKGAHTTSRLGPHLSCAVFVADVRVLRAAGRRHGAVLQVCFGHCWCFNSGHWLVDWPRYRIRQFPPITNSSTTHCCCWLSKRWTLEDGISFTPVALSGNLAPPSHVFPSREAPNRVWRRTPGPASEVWYPLLRGGADFPYPCFRAPPQEPCWS